MRKRFQKGSIKKVNGVWIGQWWEDGHRRNPTLGRVAQVVRSQFRICTPRGVNYLTSVVFGPPNKPLQVARIA